MPKSEPKPRQRTQQVKDQNPPPPGYPTTEDHPTPKKCCHSTTKKGDRGFIEGCIFALCCCWICEECF